jgi:hypothetical protein
MHESIHSGPCCRKLSAVSRKPSHSVLIVPRLSLIVNRRSQLETGTWQLEPRGEAALRPAAVINPVILILQIVSPLGSL